MGGDSDLITVDSGEPYYYAQFAEGMREETNMFTSGEPQYYAETDTY